MNKKTTQTQQMKGSKNTSGRTTHHMAPSSQGHKDAPFGIFLNIPTKGNKKLEKILEKIRKHERCRQLWECCNVMAITRLKMSDHGPVHVTLISNMAIKIFRNLVSAGVVPSLVKDYEMTVDDAEIVVLLGALFHDIGNSAHRDLHDNVGMVLAYPVMDDLLTGIYTEREKQIILCDTLHAMLAHDTATACNTVEAACVRIADGLDMKMGRAAIGFKMGSSDIHTVSAMSITDVKIGSTPGKPVAIEIDMNNSAGIFQIDNLLRKKIQGSGVEKHVSVVAHVHGDTEKRILEKYEFGK